MARKTGARHEGQPRRPRRRQPQIRHAEVRVPLPARQAPGRRLRRGASISRRKGGRSVTAAVAGIGRCLDRRPREGGDPPRGHGPARPGHARGLRRFWRFGEGLRPRGEDGRRCLGRRWRRRRGRERTRGGFVPVGQRRIRSRVLDGEKVVSARAIKHVDALAAIAKEGVASAAVLFRVARGEKAAPSGPTRRAARRSPRT